MPAPVRLDRPRDSQTRPPALQPQYLAALGAVLVVLLAVLALNEMRAARLLITDAMEEGAALLVEAVARAGENAIRADAQLEAATADRLLAQARLLRELDRADLLSDTSLVRLAAETGLYRINLFDAEGRRVLSNSPDDHGQERAEGPHIEALLGGQEDVVSGFRDGRFHAGERYAAGVGRVGGGAIIVNIDAAEMLAFRRSAGIGRLMQDIGAKADIAYLVLQDLQGVVLASRGVSGMPRIAGDAFLEAALAGEGPQSRLVDRDGAELFETVLPFWVDEDNRGLIRVGLVADAMAVAESRSRRRLAIWAGLLAVIGVALVAIIAVRQNYALLDEAHARMQTYSSRLLEDMADGVVAIDHETRISVYNRAAQRLFGVDAEVALHGSAAEVLGEAGSVLSRCVREERELRGEACRCATPDGRTLDLSVSLSLLRTREGRLETAVAVIQDLTERRALEASLQRHERLSAMGELASGVAHEVRNPLNAIGVIAQRLQREFTPTEDGDEYGQLTRTVRDEVGRVNNIVRQFLELARPPALRLAATDLDALLAGTERVARHEAEDRGVDLVTDVGDLGTARVDAEQLQQAILNLLVNAIDAAAGQAEANATVTVVGRRTEEGYTIAVTDTGPGIPATDRERIFDLYFTTKPAGTGLGLALVHRVVTEHGGRIDVDTDVGRGSTFTIRLPSDSSPRA